MEQPQQPFNPQVGQLWQYFINGIIYTYMWNGSNWVVISSEQEQKNSSIINYIDLIPTGERVDQGQDFAGMLNQMIAENKPKEELDEAHHEEPQWTQHFNYVGQAMWVCPICCALVSNSSTLGEKPHKDRHEHWHKTVACDWYEDKEGS